MSTLQSAFPAKNTKMSQLKKANGTQRRQPKQMRKKGRRSRQRMAFFLMSGEVQSQFAHLDLCKLRP